VRANASEYGVDPERLGIFGISSGGNISLLTAAQGGAGDANAADPLDRESDQLGAVACFYPPTDFRNWGEPGKLHIPYRGPEETADDAALAELYSPVAHFTKSMPPAFIMHGDKDASVPMQQAHVAIARLKELGVEHHLEERPGKEHGWPGMGPEYALCAEWLQKHLGGAV
jgi:acetyl esterase/lipase